MPRPADADASDREEQSVQLQDDLIGQLKVTTRPYPIAEADKALIDLSQGHLTGAAVLTVAEVPQRR
jgi:hypothetical protein